MDRRVDDGRVPRGVDEGSDLEIIEVAPLQWVSVTGTNRSCILAQIRENVFYV